MHLFIYNVHITTKQSVNFIFYAALAKAGHFEQEENYDSVEIQKFL